MLRATERMLSASARWAGVISPCARATLVSPKVSQRSQTSPGAVESCEHSGQVAEAEAAAD
eukprot:12979877-Alexandrium_andersonii.AAC.1